MSLILEHGNRLEDAFLLLYYTANEIDLKELKVQQLNQEMEEGFEVEKKFDALIHIYEYVTTNLKAEQNTIKKLFKVVTQNFATLGTLSMLWDFRSFYDSVTLYHEKILSTDFKGRMKEFIRILDDQEAIVLMDNVPENIEGFLKFLEHSECSKEDSFEILMVLYNPVTYYEQVSQLLIKTIGLLHDCSSEIAYLERSFFEYWTEYEKTGNIMKSIKEYLCVEYPDSKKGIIVRPRLFHPHSITIDFEYKEQEKDIIDLGFLINRNFAFNYHKIDKVDVIKIGKVFAENSKLDILEYVKRTPAYGRELATKMNLTTATISYHVNALVELGFLKTYIEGGRVYYQTNAERIKEVLKELDQYVTLELT